MSGAVWPADEVPRDPFSEPPPPAEADPDPAFRERLGRAWSEPDDGLWAEVVARGLDGPLLPERQRPKLVDEPATEREMASLAAGQDPAIGATAPDLLLGPWADRADRWSRLVAVAHAAFLRGDGVDVCPVERWSREHPAPPVDARARVRAVARAPLAPWRVRAIADQRVQLEPALPLGEPLVPDGPVLLRDVAAPAGPLRVGGGLLARVVATTAGPVAWGAIAAELPSDARLVGWVRRLGWEVRLADRRRDTVADVLRQRGHTLTRLILESRWP